MQVKHTVKRLLYEGNLYGEWWIEDGGSVEFADGDVGDQNHESIAFQAALGVYFDDFHDTESDIERNVEDILSIIRQDLIASADLADEFDKHVDEIDPDEAGEFFKEAARNIESGTLSELEAAILLGIGADSKAVKWFLESRMADAREYMITKHNWIRVQGHNFQMGEFDEDAKHRIADFLQEEGQYEPEDVVPGEEHITIEEYPDTVIEVDIHDMLNPHVTADDIWKKERQPAGLSPGMMVGGGEPQL